MKIPKFTPRTLNIFTDASILELLTGEFVGCSGAVAYTGVETRLKLLEEEFCCNRHTNNNEAELRAIYLGICLGIKYKNQFEAINLFSDSKNCIFGLREWVFEWVERSTGDMLIGSTNQPVKYHSDILKCIYTILDNDLNIKLYHQKGHVECHRLRQNAIDAFKSSNFEKNVYLTNEFIEQISECNCYVDKKTKDILAACEISSIEERKEKEYKYQPFDCEKYKALVTN